MQPSLTPHRNDARLRFLFDDKVVSIDRALDLTYWEIAEALDDLRERHGDPIAIDVAIGTGRDESADLPAHRVLALPL